MKKCPSCSKFKCAFCRSSENQLPGSTPNNCRAPPTQHRLCDSEIWGEFWECTFLMSSHPRLEKAMATHSSTLAWKIPWMEEPGGLKSMGSQRVRHSWATSCSLFTFMHWRRKATHSSVLAWRIPGMGEPGWLTSMGSQRVGHDWSHLASKTAALCCSRGSQFENHCTIYTT